MSLYFVLCWVIPVCLGIGAGVPVAYVWGWEAGLHLAGGIGLVAGAVTGLVQELRQ